MVAIKGGKFSLEQKAQWVQRIGKTHEAQQYLLFGSLHGIYSDPASNEEARVNSLSIADEFSRSFTPKARSDLINRHHDYIANGDEKRHKASQQFFEKLGMLALLGEHEVHSLLSNASKRLMSVHQAFDNFYNEPSFADRLLQLSLQAAIPDSVKEELVTTVITCAVGNSYGVSNAAIPCYEKIIKGFSPSEVETMLSLPGGKSIVAMRIKGSTACKNRFINLVSLIDPTSVPVKAGSAYSFWKK